MGHLDFLAMERQLLSYKLPLFRRTFAIMSRSIQESFSLLNQREKDRLKRVSQKEGLANPDRNRYSNIIPWDHTRIKLRTSKDGNNYINANRVTLVAKKNTKTYHKTYIATQGPLRQTAGHFWQMVHDTTTEQGQESDKPTVVIQVTPFEDNHGERCCQYYISRKGQVFEVDGEGDVLTVEVKDNSEVGPTKVTEFLVTKGSTGKVKRVVHYYYPHWADFSAPGVNTDIDDIVKSAGPITDSPPIVHCSAGVGRTGTYIVADFLTTFQKELQGEDIVCSLVDQMRQQRSHMVQTISQYEYLHSLQTELLH
ncbi:protein-tyrosine phosphatase-like protein [Yarrowia lipolytica]|nr:protein-tyrosine phosphatase-like protein [Yarrowia lipolytica]RDW46410.1 protein-tyrosine phosphatase-like protein [Yarrowia lipolytica]RDW52862.1 protein-tyrosine phosphatase-like protein [Yarrowia lipolytica]